MSEPAMIIDLAPGVRPAGPADVPLIAELIMELAVYERSADQVKITTDQLEEALFGPAPTVGCLIAEQDHQPVGFALHFPHFSTWAGKGLYLEDLYVRPSARGSGLGKALITSVAAIAAATGCARLEWSVLDWNTPAIDFYRALGAVAQDEWTRYRLSGQALTAAAALTSTDG